MISHICIYTEKTGHENVNIDHFEILSKLVEALHIKHERPTLNVQDNQCHYCCSTDEVQWCSWNRQTSKMELFCEIS